MEEIIPKSARKEIAEESSTLVEDLGDSVSKPGVIYARSQKAVKVTHKKFGSEDVDTPEPSPLEGKINDVASEISSESDNESEDEAPDTVTASAGFKNARTVILEAAKIAARQEANNKAKRRERDRLLKSQAKASSKHKQSKSKPLPSNRLSKDSEIDINISQPQDKSQTQPKPASKPPLPIYLPESVLAASPPSLPSAQPPTHSTSTTRKRKFLDPEPKRPKDLKRGNMTIRVMQEEKTLLPPKVSKNGRALREAWLMGRRQGGVVPRREARWGTQFVRR